MRAISASSARPACRCRRRVHRHRDADRLDAHEAHARRGGSTKPRCAPGDVAEAEQCGRRPRMGIVADRLHRIEGAGDAQRRCGRRRLETAAGTTAFCAPAPADDGAVTPSVASLVFESST
jgi:hypothetical protein